MRPMPTAGLAVRWPSFGQARCMCGFVGAARFDECCDGDAVRGPGPCFEAGTQSQLLTLVLCFRMH